MFSRMLGIEVKKIFKFSWIFIAIVAIIYDIYLHSLISYFDYSYHSLKSDFVKDTILYSIVTFPLGFITGVLFSLFDLTISSNLIFIKVLNFITIIINYYLIGYLKIFKRKNVIYNEALTIGVGKKSPLPPNRTCDSLAYGSLVDSFLIGIDTLCPKLHYL
jgi:hypothetical protein